MQLDGVRKVAALSLLGLVAASLGLFLRSQESAPRPQPERTGPSPSGAIPPDHPQDGAPLFETRLGVIEQRLEEDPEDARAILELARLLHDAHRPLEAVPYYRRYLVVHPDSSRAWLDLANAFGAAGDWEASGEASQGMLDRFPGHPDALYNMGAALANQRRFADAREWWVRAAASNDSLVARRARESLARLPGG